MQDSSRCAGCGCELLAGAQEYPASGVVAAMQFVQRALGRQVFICRRCAAERYEARHRLQASGRPA